MIGYLCKSLRIISLVWPTRLIFPSKVYDISDSPIHVSCISDIVVLSTRVEVLVTGSTTNSSHAKVLEAAAAARAGQSDPLCATM